MTTHDLTPTAEDMALDLHALLRLLNGIDHPLWGDSGRYRAFVVKWMSEGFREWKAAIRRALAAEARAASLARELECVSRGSDAVYRAAREAQAEVARLRSILARAESEGG